jgi:DNA-binding LacI/PurR family transcriptional regulator
MRRDAVERSKLILETAERLGYRPNASARAMKSGCFNAIGLVQGFDVRRSNLPDELLVGVHQTVLKFNQHMVLARLPDEKLASTGFVPKILRELMVDGLLVCYSHEIPTGMIELIREHAIPSVWLNVHQEFNSVRPDDIQAGRLATEHLLRHGHRKIAFCDFEHDEAFMFGPLSHYSLRHRYEGYCQAMKEAGLPTRLILGPKRREESEFPQPPVRLDWLEESDHPTGIVAYGGWGLLRVALRAQEKFGDLRAISMVTVNSRVQICEDIAIDTVILPQQQIGREAIELLQKRIQDPLKSIPSRVIPCELRAGFSVKKA